MITDKGVPVFLYFQNEAEYAKVSKDGKLFNYANFKSISMLSKDFEASGDWKIQSGDGEFSSIKEHKITGEYSLLAKAASGKDMVLQRSLGDIEIKQPQFIVLIWSTKKFASDDKYFMPALGASYIMHGKRHYIRVPLGKTNEGMNLYVKEKTSGEEYYWQVHLRLWLPRSVHAGHF